MRGEPPQIFSRLVLVELGTLAIALPAIAGAVNAAGFMVVGAYLSHVTGNLARVGDELALGRFEAAWRYGVLIGAFFGGALLATTLIEISKRLNKPHYLAAMLIEGAMLGAFSLISALTSPGWHENNLLLMVLLSSSMGLQNAMVSRLSGAVVRTTHMTGIITDIGIETVRLVFEAKDRSVKQPLIKRLATLLTIGSDSEARRLRLLTYIFLSFTFGAVVGPLVYLQIGYWGAIGPTLILLGLAVFDYYAGIEWHPEAHFVPQGRPANAQFLALVAAELERNPEKAKAAMQALKRRSLSQPHITTPPVKVEEEVVLSPPGSPAAVSTPAHPHSEAGDSARTARAPEPTPAPPPDESADSLEASGVLKAPHGQTPS